MDRESPRSAWRVNLVQATVNPPSLLRNFASVFTVTFLKKVLVNRLLPPLRNGWLVQVATWHGCVTFSESHLSHVSLPLKAVASSWLAAGLVELRSTQFVHTRGNLALELIKRPRNGLSQRAWMWRHHERCLIVVIHQKTWIILDCPSWWKSASVGCLGLERDLPSSYQMPTRIAFSSPHKSCRALHVSCVFLSVEQSSGSDWPLITRYNHVTIEQKTLLTGDGDGSLSDKRREDVIAIETG